MLGNQKVQAVLHSGCQDPHAFFTGSDAWVQAVSESPRGTSRCHHTYSAHETGNRGQSAECKGASGWRKNDEGGGGGHLEHGGRKACLPWFAETLSCHG